MPKGFSLHLGLNSVDPKHYAGWSGELNACEADALDMQAITEAAGFTANTFLTEKATRTNVADFISTAASSLESNDIFVLSYSGHGGQLPDLSGEEPDLKDETWCLFDGEIVDDEIYLLLGKFKEGVRIAVFSDSCHSGSVVRDLIYRSRSGQPSLLDTAAVYRVMPDEVAARVYNRHRAFYNDILSNPEMKTAKEMVRASVILISGCQDNQLSADGTFNGLFTGMLKKVWKHGAFAGSYRNFHKSILSLMPPDQSPDFFTVGKKNAVFEQQRPFSIS